MKRIVRTAVGIALAIGLAACGGGGGGGGGGKTTAWAVSGLCASCTSNINCAEGLVCQNCTGDCPGAGRRCAGLATAAGDAVRCDNAAYPSGCVNIAGTWEVEEDVTGECIIGEDIEDLDSFGRGEVTFTQKGCEISYRVPEANVTRKGTIVGNRIHLSGPFLKAFGGGVSFRENIATIEGSVDGNQMFLSGSGHGSGKVQGEAFECTGEAIVVARRS